MYETAIDEINDSVLLARGCDADRPSRPATFAGATASGCGSRIIRRLLSQARVAIANDDLAAIAPFEGACLTRTPSSSRYLNSHLESSEAANAGKPRQYDAETSSASLRFAVNKIDIYGCRKHRDARLDRE